MPPHRAVAVALGDPEINAACKQSGKEDEAFGCGEKTQRLIDVGAQDRRQMSAGDPDQHQAAKGIEFFYSVWHRLPVITCLQPGHRLRCTSANHGTLRIAWPSDLASNMHPRTQAFPAS